MPSKRKAKLHNNETHKMWRIHMSSSKPKCTSAVQTDQICMCVLCVNYDPYGSRLKSHVYMHALKMHAYIIHTWTSYHIKGSLVGANFGEFTIKTQLSK